MKQFWIYSIIFLMIAAFAGCDSVKSPIQTGVNSPSPTGQPTPESTAVPDIVQPEMSKIYKSDALGMSFTVPESWVGKYRVEEDNGCLTVLFDPAAPVNKDIGDGVLFYYYPGGFTGRRILL